MTLSKKIRALLLAGTLCVGMPAHAGWLSGVGKKSWALAAGAIAGAAALGYVGYTYYWQLRRALRQRRLNYGLIDCVGAARARSLLERGADVNFRDARGNTLLNWACGDEDVGLVKLLIEHGADVNVRDDCGYTPLAVVCGYGNVDLAKILIEHGADISAKDNQGRTPLDSAKSEAMKQLLTDTQQQRAKSRVLTLEGLAKMDGEEGRPFNVMSMLKRDVLQEVAEFATSECLGYEGRGLSSERLNIEYRVQQKEEEQE